MSKKIIREYIRKIINEIDFADEFSDVKSSCINPKELLEYLNGVLSNRGVQPYSKRKKFDGTYPYLHASSEHLGEGSEVNIDAFIKSITNPPPNLVSQNDKLAKTGDSDEYAYNTGIPAISGLVYDEENNKFYSINTCPGAGSCVNICYARHGYYIIYPATNDLMIRRLNYLLNHPDKYEEQLYNEIKELCIKHKAFVKNDNTVLIRWNDSGDFFSKKYVKIAASVMRRLKDEGFNIRGGAHTKVASVALGDDIASSFSADSNKKEMGKFRRGSIEKYGSELGGKKSITVPKKMFSKLNLLIRADVEILKDRIANEYEFDRSKLLNYKELLMKPIDSGSGYGVVIVPGNGDDGLFRKDISVIFHAQH